MTKTIALILALTTALPAHAGGLVIIEETDTAPIVRSDKKVPAWVFLALGAVVVAAIAGGGSDVCNTPEPEPEPEPVGGC